MPNQRYSQLAKILIDYSVSAKPHEKVWIKCSGLPSLTLGREVYKYALQIGARPYLDIADDSLLPFFYEHAHPHHYEVNPEVDEFLADWADCIVRIVGEENTKALINTEPGKILSFAKTQRKVRSVMLAKRWTLTWVPSNAIAQESGMSLDEFEDFYFGACLRDWKKESTRIEKIADKLNGSKTVHIVGKDTDLTLSVTNRIWIPDIGDCNMPAGEVFTSPVENKTQGYISFDFPLFRFGKMIRDIKLWFEKGRVVKATASENEETLHKILDTDAGARILGEVAIGLNPGITSYVNNTLFDEKIMGTIHMAIGESFDICNGKNKSHIHMDIVKDMRSKGSFVEVDGKIVLQEGKILL